MAVNIKNFRDFLFSVLIIYVSFSLLNFIKSCCLSGRNPSITAELRAIGPGILVCSPFLTGPNTSVCCEEYSRRFHLRKDRPLPDDKPHVCCDGIMHPLFGRTEEYNDYRGSLNNQLGTLGCCPSPTTRIA